MINCVVFGVGVWACLWFSEVVVGILTVEGTVVWGEVDWAVPEVRTDVALVDLVRVGVGKLYWSVDSMGGCSMGRLQAAIQIQLAKRKMIMPIDFFIVTQASCWGQVHLLSHKSGFAGEIRLQFQLSETCISWSECG